MVVSYIALGSNLGNRQYYIEAAIRKIRKLINTRVNKISSIIETQPEAEAKQSLYLNCVIEITTDLAPYELLQRLQIIESDLGRVRTIKNAPRRIDLDILLYGDIHLEEDMLCIPHPRMREREFVIQPLREIAPGLVKKLKSEQNQGKKKLSRK